jgi:hypothetical protein
MDPKGGLERDFQPRDGPSKDRNVRATVMDIKELQEKVIEFRDARDWAEYHNPKDLAISLSLEAAELLEIFQWKDGQEALEAAR